MESKFISELTQKIEIKYKECDKDYSQNKSEKYKNFIEENIKIIDENIENYSKLIQ